jgi:hypothetical protein
VKQIAITALLTFGMAVVAEANAEWLSKEFKDTWDVPGQGAEEFLNRDCQPSGLDGIQVFAVQKGHGSSYNLHLSCRQDKVATAHYTVRMIDVPRGKLDATFTPLLANSKVRIGPFFFGKVDAPDGVDGILVIEKTK